MSKKSKKLRKEFRERGQKLNSFEDVKNAFSSSTSEHYRKPKEEKPKYDNKHQQKTTSTKIHEIIINEIKPSSERPNAFTLNANVTTKGIPTVVEYSNEKGCRFITLANGEFKKAIWSPRGKELSNGVQALIPVTRTNIIVDYNVDEGVLNIFKINKIDESKGIIHVFLYNKFDFNKDEWSKPVFDSLAFIPQCAKNKIETNSKCFKTKSYKDNDVENNKLK